MAKKAKKDVPAKKRKTTKATVTPRTEEAPPLGTVAISVQLECNVQNTSPFDEMVIELGCLGLSEEPDRITSSNPLLDPERPPTTSEEGVHLYFKPPLQGAGRYGFNLACVYNEAVEARTAAPEVEDIPPEAEAA